MKDEIKIITLGDIFKNIETEEKAFKFKDYITNLQKENEILRKNAEHNDKVVDKAKWNEMIYKSRNKKAIDEVIRVLQIILEQPSKDKLDDLWIINKLEGIQTLLQGGDSSD